MTAPAHLNSARSGPGGGAPHGTVPCFESLLRLYWPVCRPPDSCPHTALRPQPRPCDPCPCPPRHSSRARAAEPRQNRPPSAPSRRQRARAPPARTPRASRRSRQNPRQGATDSTPRASAALPSLVAPGSAGSEQILSSHERRIGGKPFLHGAKDREDRRKSLAR